MVLQFEKPAAGSWTEAFGGLGTGPMSYEDSISPEFHELEREAIFRRTWLNVGRVEQLPRRGSYFTKELAVCDTSVIVVRGSDDEIRAFHNICRHRGNKLVWQDYPNEETQGTCRNFTCKYHVAVLAGGRPHLRAAGAGVLRPRQGRLPARAGRGDVWEGFVFVNLDRNAGKDGPEPLHDFMGEMGEGLEGYPFGECTQVFDYRGGGQQLEAVHRRLPGILPRTRAAPEAEPARCRGAARADGVRRCALRASRSAPHGVDERRHG